MLLFLTGWFELTRNRSEGRNRPGTCHRVVGLADRSVSTVLGVHRFGVYFHPDRWLCCCDCEGVSWVSTWRVKIGVCGGRYVLSIVIVGMRSSAMLRLTGVGFGKMLPIGKMRGNCNGRKK